MNVVTLCLFLLLAVVASSIVSRILPSALPRPLVQIGLGALIGLFAGVRVELDPELFFLLLVPPLGAVSLTRSALYTMHLGL